MNKIIEGILKAPYNLLLLFPSIAFLGMAGYAIYKDKDTWIYASFACVGALFFLLVQRKIKEEAKSSLNSNEWMNEIADKLEDCGSANIYLRRFDHPDNFKNEHREVLLKIMEKIKTKIDNGSDLKVIAYVPDSTSKSGKDWLIAHTKNKQNIDNCIIVINSQPTANSSSIYIFDDRTSLYNKIYDGKITYHSENFSTSIIHELMSRGFSNLAGERS